MLGKSKVKYIQSLGQKKGRNEEGVFIAEGPKLVAELLAAGNVIIKEVYALKEWMDEHAAGLKGAEAFEISEDELGKISQLSTPNQVLIIVKKFTVPDIDPSNKITLALDGIQDPGNLGTIIRIADWFGLTQIVCSRDCADMYNPKVVQSTMGSLVRVNMLYTDLTRWLSAQKNIDIYAAILDGEDITSVKKIKEGILVIGNESKGISDEVMSLADEGLTIPGSGNTESLNAAVATGIILSHVIHPL